MLLCCLFLVFYACSDEHALEVPPENESPYERMGRLHNECLDYVLEKILATAPSTRSGGRVIPSETVIRRICSDFARAKQCQVSTRAIESREETAEDFSFLSAVQQDWLLRIKEVVWTAVPDGLDKFRTAVSRLEERLAQDREVDEKEKEVLFYVVAVCRHSALYWAENFEKWQLELYGINGVSTPKIRTKSEGEYVTKEWWEKYKGIVWSDGVGGVKCGELYYLENAAVGSVKEYLRK